MITRSSLEEFKKTTQAITNVLKEGDTFTEHTDKELVDIAVRLLLNDQLTSELSGVRNALRFMNDPRYN